MILSMQLPGDMASERCQILIQLIMLTTPQMKRLSEQAIFNQRDTQVKFTELEILKESSQVNRQSICTLTLLIKLTLMAQDKC